MITLIQQVNTWGSEEVSSLPEVSLLGRKEARIWSQGSVGIESVSLLYIFHIFIKMQIHKSNMVYFNVNGNI